MDKRGSEPVFTFLEDGTGDGVTWTLADLDRAARQVAARLVGLVAPGGPVLLMAAPSLEYLAGFFGCMYAGAIAVPAYPPSPFHGRDNMDRLQSVADNAGVAVGLTTELLLPSVTGFTVSNQEVQWVLIAPDETDGAAAVDLVAQPPSLRADDIAFLQYTSGSTGDPKGVIVSQGNLLANAMMIGEVYENRPGLVMVSWLPPYHDMGLIGMLLTAPVLSLHTVFMPPAAFLRRPVRWLQAISRFGAEASAGPNFAYETCIEKVKEADLAGLDLSAWRVAINGAEPVRAATLERFAQRFAPYGFQQTAFRPSYGLAETTLLATSGTAKGPTFVDVDSEALSAGSLRLSDGTSDSQRLVSSGFAPPGTTVRIIDPETGTALQEGQVGEVEVTGPHVAGGYWQRPDATAERFDGRTVRTGDLGVLLGDELVVTGRIKDVMIIRGRNYYPQDIERTVEEAHTSFRPNSGTAFTVQRADRELLVVVQEVTLALVGEPGAVVEQIRRAVTTAHGISPAAVVLTRPGGVPKTSSGKVRRGDTRQRYEDSELLTVFSWPTQPEPAAGGA